VAKALANQLRRDGNAVHCLCRARVGFERDVIEQRVKITPKDEARVLLDPSDGGLDLNVAEAVLVARVRLPCNNRNKISF
jgi:hypothetical protein